MEIVLAAATPFQLLAGKVLGVGFLAILQYAMNTSDINGIPGQGNFPPPTAAP